MKNQLLLLLSFVILFGTSNITVSTAQCVWQTELFDGFEYTTPCPYLIPGATIHVAPQSFAAYSGSLSLYLNFTNCVGGAGTCAGAKVFERAFAVCPNTPLRFSTWLTSTFSGQQCDVKITITDANGTVLDNQLNILAPFQPAWIQYQSATVTPITDTVYFTMYTNVGGGNGNDLSMDDFLIEKCIGGEGSLSTSSFCENVVSVNLFNALPSMLDSTGTWTGPGTLGGGFLGTFTPGTSAPGTYVYQNYPYGASCLVSQDSIITSALQVPVVNLGPDTTLCINQSILLNAGTGTGYTYLWSNSVTGPNALAFTTSQVNVTNTYYVTVTAPTGCANSDTIVVNFDVCAGLNESGISNSIQLFPNPASEYMYIHFENIPSMEITFEVYHATGGLILKGNTLQAVGRLDLTTLQSGLYFMKVTNETGEGTVLKFVVQK